MPALALQSLFWSSPSVYLGALSVQPQSALGETNCSIVIGLASLMQSCNPVFVRQDLQIVYDRLHDCHRGVIFILGQLGGGPVDQRGDASNSGRDRDTRRALERISDLHLGFEKSTRNGSICQRTPTCGSAVAISQAQQRQQDYGIRTETRRSCAFSIDFVLNDLRAAQATRWPVALGAETHKVRLCGLPSGHRPATTGSSMARSYRVVAITLYALLYSQ